MAMRNGNVTQPVFFFCLLIGLAAGCRSETVNICPGQCDLPDTEEHPILFVRGSDRTALLQKLSSSTIGGDEVGSAFAAWIKGQRDQASIDFITSALSGNDSNAIYQALLVYDVQYEFMTDQERCCFRSAFLANAQAVYDEATSAQPPWYFMRRMVNNWTYRYAGSPLPRLLLAGIMFHSDPRAADFANKGLELVRWLFEVNPNNGVWDRDASHFDVDPTQGEMNDEVLATPNSYGLWAADNLTHLFDLVDHATDFHPYQYLGQAIYQEGRYWTYLLSFAEGINWNDMNWYSFASYAGQTGHGDFDHLGYYSNAYMLHYARMYNEPVFAWHYYANPSPTRFDGNYATTWSQGKEQYASWLEFLDWGAVAPTDPATAGWPLSAFFPNSGVGVIRKSWNKKGPGSGIIWLRAGPGASHDRPMYGTVQIHADDQVLLGAAPSTYDSEYLTRDPHVNNTLFIDDQGERGYYSQSLELDRLRHGHTQQIDADTFLMDMSPRSDVDFLSAFVDHPYAVSWTRKVHYDRNRDLVCIQDVASTDDGASHRYRFNWVSNATARSADAWNLPAGYVMVARTNAPALLGEVQSHADPALQTPFTAIYAGGDGTAIQMWWVIGKDEQAARSMLSGDCEG